MRRSALLAAALWAGPVVAAGIDFRGVQLGVSEAEFVAGVPGFTCAATTFHSLRPFSDRRCEPDLGRVVIGVYDFGGAKAEAIAALFIDGRFGQLNVTFKEGDFDQIASALKAKYGPPTTVANPPYRTRGGASGTNTALTWRIGDGTVIVTHYGSRIDEGFAMYQADWMRDAQRARREQTTKDGVKSL